MDDASNNNDCFGSKWGKIIVLSMTKYKQDRSGFVWSADPWSTSHSSLLDRFQTQERQEATTQQIRNQWVTSGKAWPSRNPENSMMQFVDWIHHGITYEHISAHYFPPWSTWRQVGDRGGEIWGQSQSCGTLNDRDFDISFKKARQG